MTTLKLTKGKTVKISVLYGNAAPNLERPAVKPGQKAYREDFISTSVYLTVQDEEGKHAEFYGRSYCSPTDQYNKAKGRRLAISRAFSRDEHKVLSKKDRKRIIEAAVLPFITRWR